MVCNEKEPDAALDTFMKLLILVTNKHAPIKKIIVKTVKSPWIDEELKKMMVERDEAKAVVKKVLNCHTEYRGQRAGCLVRTQRR
jgi:hypothetical protein